MSEKPQNSPGVPDNDPNSDAPIIDPALKEEVQQNGPEGNLFAEYMSGDTTQQNEEIDVTQNWIGDEMGDNWKPKSILSTEQIIALTQVRILPQAFEELEGIENILLDTVENLEQYGVSREGIAREQHVSVLEAMHSGESTPDEAGDLMAKMFANPENNDE